MDQHSNEGPNILAGLEAELFAFSNPEPTPHTPPASTASNVIHKRSTASVPFSTPGYGRATTDISSEPKRELRSGDPVDLSSSILAKIQRAADLSNENCDRATALAQRLSLQLRAAEDRVCQLEIDLQRAEERADRAERVLRLIEQEIDKS